MRKLLLVVPILLVVAACSSNSDNSTLTSPTPSATTANAKPTVAAAGTTVKVADSSKGKILTNASGMTLYKFDNDTSGKSNCEAACATTWPPLTFSGSGTPTGTSGLSLITRTDGTKQVAYNGAPLYTYSGDTSAGQTNGDGFAGKWHVVKAS